MTVDTKLYPYCSEEIKATAIKCKHCGSMLTELAPGTPAPMAPMGAGLGQTTSPGATPEWGLAGGRIPDGTRVREYRIFKMLGQGGMGDVYLAEHADTGQRVAMKVIAPELTRKEVTKKRFLEEARVMANLDHPNIVRLITFFQEQERFFLLMDYVHGDNLDDLLGGKAMAPEEAIHIVREVLDALGYAHSRPRPVIHRDIKPGNILLREDGHVILTDFGIAKALGRERLTKAGDPVGTYEYMSPEQVQGVELTPAADVYALGVTLFQMLAGRAPFPQESEGGFECMRAHVDQPPPPLSSVRPGLAPGIQKILDRMLEKNPARRGTPEELRPAMERMLVDSDRGPQSFVATPSLPTPAPTPAPASSSASAGTPAERIKEPFEMVRIESGTFLMGSPKNEEGRHRNEAAQAEVTISRPFFVKTTPVTNLEWKRVSELKSVVLDFHIRDWPVTMISWVQAVLFCNALSEKEGLEPVYRPEGLSESFFRALPKCKNVVFKGLDRSGYRLPTEAEWEYVARAGTRTPYWTGEKLTLLQANFILPRNEDYFDAVMGHRNAVKHYAPNPWGLYDVHGNVHEFVWDRFSPSALDGAPRTDPVGPGGPGSRVIRGGSYDSHRDRCRSAARGPVNPLERSPGVGFRVVRTINADAGDGR